jgi:hypothetical protein
MRTEDLSKTGGVSLAKTMNAVITSTLSPSSSMSLDGNRSSFSPEERLLQTQQTVQSLLTLGIKNILVLDNSPCSLPKNLHKLLEPAEVRFFAHPIFLNRGISELWLLLSASDLISIDQPLLKVSGRYLINDSSPLGGSSILNHDIVALVNTKGRIPLLSTRAYAVRNGRLAIDLWRAALSEIYGYGLRIRGPRSFVRIIRNSVFRKSDITDYSDPKISIEHAMCLAARSLNLTIGCVPVIGVSGLMGSGNGELINE